MDGFFVRVVYGNRPRPRPGAEPLGHGRRVDSLDGSAEPSEECLRSHRWVWNGSRLEGLLTTSGTPVFVCGTAVNKMGSWTCSLRSFYSGSTPGSKKNARSHTRGPPTRSGRSGKGEIREGRLNIRVPDAAAGRNPG